MIGVIDESTPDLADGRLLYSLALVVLDDFAADSFRSVLRDSFQRKNPFHWERDHGEPTRRRMIDEICATNVRVHVAAIVVESPNDQDAQRRRLLSNWLLPAAHDDNVDQLLIEQRSQRQNDIEKRSVRDWHRVRRVEMPFVQHVTKTEPLAWAADACAGLWADYVTGIEDRWLMQLVQARKVGLSYIAP